MEKFIYDPTYLGYVLDFTLLRNGYGVTFHDVSSISSFRLTGYVLFFARFRFCMPKKKLR